MSVIRYKIRKIDVCYTLKMTKKISQLYATKYMLNIQQKIMPIIDLCMKNTCPSCATKEMFIEGYKLCFHQALQSQRPLYASKYLSIICNEIHEHICSFMRIKIHVHNALQTTCPLCAKKHLVRNTRTYMFFYAHQNTCP